MRCIILHHHIFKNAGTSLDFSLQEFFNENFVEFNKNSEFSRILPEELFEFLESNPDLQAVSSHHFHGYDFENDLKYSIYNHKYYFFDFIMIRHPISRLVSMYLYYRSLPSDAGDFLIPYCHKLSFNGFIEFLIKNHPNYVVNPQVTMLGSDHYGAPPNPKNLDRAINRLLKCSMLGLVERFGDSLLVAEYFLQPVFPKLKLKLTRQNISNLASIPGYDGSLESIENNIGASSFKKLCKLNDLDIKLWNFVDHELKRRKSYVPEYDNALI